jgi:uncharacterized secreted protein with C-terminal beta-propeller domain
LITASCSGRKRNVRKTVVPGNPVLWRRRMMHKMRRSKLAGSGVRLVAFLVTVLVSLGSASAKDPKGKNSENEARVVAHISFSGFSSVDMAMQRKVNDKYYLYVQHSKDEGVSIIDISKPAQAKILSVISWPDQAVSSRMDVAGNLAIIAESEILTTRGSRSNDDLVLWDLSNPAAPRVVQKFTGVVKWLQDERNFIYVLNRDGLWVISEPPDRQPELRAPATNGD